MDFSKVKIHCSSLGCLFTEPRSVEDKKKGNLSATAKTHLIKVYSKEYWGRQRRITTKQMEKGTTQEKEGIKLLGKFDGCDYVKNETVLENDYIIGTPDILWNPKKLVIDTKLSWDSETFLPNVMCPLEKDYEYQVHGYMELAKFEMAKVSYVLVNASIRQILDEQRRLLYSMDVVSEESPEYVLAAAELEYNMVYDDIPMHERIVDKYVERDDELLKQIPLKVERAREFLAEFHSMHTKHKRELAIL